MILKRLRLLSLLLLSLISFSAGAQDKIYLMDGTTVQAKVKEVGPRNVIYTKWDNKEGAEYVVVRRDVERIVFENGSEEVFNRARGRSRRDADDNDNDNREVRRDRERERARVPGYGNNILSIAPLMMTNESVAGLGLAYERVLDKQAIFSFYLPVAFAFYDDQPSRFTSSSIVPPKVSRVFTYAYPGVKLYPAGSAHRVTYSVGPSLGFGFGTKYKENRRTDPGTGSLIISYTEDNVFKTGFMINNGLNIQPTKKLYVGLELGLGIFYYNNETTDFAAGDEPMVQFSFKMGYRF